MKAFPCCKINLGLRILRKRPDGYHDLKSVFLPVPFLHDVLEIVPINENENQNQNQNENRFTLTGIDIPGEPGENLCMKAYGILKADFPGLPPVDIHLHKCIPFGAGLGGGSADAAFTLRMLNDLFHLGLSHAQLERYAARLGADCAFFIQCRPALAEGIGDRLTPLDSNPIEGLHLLLAKPPDAVSTREAYANVKMNENDNDNQNDNENDNQNWGHGAQPLSMYVNDFEASVFPAHPAIARLKEEMLGLEAEYAAMSGSGSTVFGLFKTREGLLAAAEEIRAGHADTLLFHE